MTRRLGIVDYGMGNIRSVANAFAKLDGVPSIVGTPEQIAACDRLVLPGVGAFGAAMEILDRRGLIEPLNQFVSTGKPLLGICLGMQLIARSSQEDGEHWGLGWVDAHVVSLPAKLGFKVPHMGWNSIYARKPHALLEGFEDGGDVYFVHSYHAVCTDQSDVLLACDYGIGFVAAFARDNVMGVQFHPEKSQTIGLRMLANFLHL